MVLSRKHSPYYISARVFDGSGDVKVFLFHFQNVAMRNQEKKDYSIVFLSYLDGPALPFFFEKFSTDGSLNQEADDFNAEKEAFFEKFEKKADPQ